MNKFPKRCLVAPPALYEKVHRAYPTRKILVSIYAEQDEFYWFDRYGNVRLFTPADGKIWVADYTAGYEAFTLRKQVRPRTYEEGPPLEK